MFDRLLPVPRKSFFLLGPRGTGKSTLLREKLKPDLLIDLLLSRNFLDFSANPTLLLEKTAHLKPGAWVLIDEVQRVPALLNEVHHLVEERKLCFALSGSSARKLKRGGANLLAGRAIQTFLFPLTRRELGKSFSTEEAIQWGTLPLVVNDATHRKETLSTYVETYLRQELVEEGLIRKIEPFTRFLRVAGILNGQILNVENIARETKVGRTTVDKYFEILEDTLVGSRLPAYRGMAKVKEVQHSKFYLFDSGVARACAGLVYEEIDSAWKGFALETIVLNELRAHNHYSKKNREIFYYKISGSYEIDFVIETRKKNLSTPGAVVGIEVKYSKKWDRRWSETLEDFAKSSKARIDGLYGVYLGTEILTQGSVTLLPLEGFLEMLGAGKIF